MDSKIQESHRTNYGEMPQKSNSPTASLKKITTTTWNSVEDGNLWRGAKLFQADHYSLRWLGKVRKLISTTEGS